MTHYETLGVAPDAATEEITRAWRALAKRWHPDAHPGRAAEATQRMQVVNEAYAVLRDESRRARYDALLRETGWCDVSAEERARHGSPEAMARSARRARRAQTTGEGARPGVGPDTEGGSHSERAADRTRTREGDTSAREQETRLAERLAGMWWPAARATTDVAALRALFLEVLGPYHHLAKSGTGPIATLWREAAAFVRVADSTSAARAPAPGQPRTTTGSGPGPRSAGGRRALRRLGVVVIAPLLWHLGAFDRVLPNGPDGVGAATARVSDGTTDPKHLENRRGHASDRHLLITELRRLSDAMVRAHARAGRFPSRAPDGFRSHRAVQLRIGRTATGWVGTGDGLDGTVCRIEVTVRGPGRAHETIRCGEGLRDDLR